MSEKVTKKDVAMEETPETPAKKPAKKAADKTEKKDNFIKRGYRKVKKGMSEHPFWTAFGGAALGAGTTVAVGYTGKKIMEKRRERNAYIPDETQDPNNL